MEFITGEKKRIQRIGKRMVEELRVVTSGQTACVPIFQRAKMVLLVSLLISSLILPSCSSLPPTFSSFPSNLLSTLAGYLTLH